VVSNPLITGQMEPLVKSNFEKMYPGIHVKFATYTEGDLRAAIEKDVSTHSNSFNVIMIGPYETPLFAKNGWLENLSTQFIAKDPSYDAGDLLPPIAKSLSYKGDLYAVPFYGESSMMFYRKDLFAKAGLPTDRDQVSALWSTWDGYIEAGKKYAAAKVPNSNFMDGPAVMYRAILGQADTGLYDTNDNVVVETNPAVRAAYDKTIEALNAGLSAKIAAWSPDWNAGFAQGRFATLACPSWMMAYIQSQAKDAAGKWDIAKVPGGSGNWGGSFLTVPKQSKHAKEAYEFAKWLTSPEQQAKVFRSAGNFPSTSTLYSDPVITDFVNPFFSNAPVGKIFSESVATMKVQYLGPKAGDINTAIINGLSRVEQGKQSPDAAWAQAIEEVKKLV
jgi:cellobiose transport system substrate-binding protein